MRALRTATHLLFTLLLLLIGAACVTKPENKSGLNVAEENLRKADLTDSLNHCVDSILRLMTPEQKSAQCLIPAIYASADPYTLKRIKEYAELGTGGIILLKGDPLSVAIIADSLQRWSAISPFIAIDAELGLAMRLTDTPRFPSNGNISPEADDDSMFEYGAELARECRLLGINMVLGPVLDIAGKDSYIGSRSIGTDKERVARMGIAYARGLESGNVISVAKHFPGHGAVTVDTHRRKGIIERSLQSLDSIDLYPFREYIAQDLSAIMVGHIAFPAIDPDALPAAVSKAVITDLLRTDLGFRGLILTDAMNMRGAEEMSAADAIDAGADLILAPKSTTAEIHNILSRFYPDSITRTQVSPLDEHIKRILFKKMLINDPRLTKLSQDSILTTKLNSTEAINLAKSLAR
ncbi:MAG: hypothetical protein K2K97_06705 [Muribaculaceae bacterium]|nr:hypothetical protein [Muribaculaceae bacterium]